MKCSGKAVSVTVRRSKDGTKNYVDLTVAEDFRSPVQVVGVEEAAQDDALDLQEGDDVEAVIEQRSFEGKIRLVAVSIKSKKPGVASAKAA